MQYGDLLTETGFLDVQERAQELGSTEISSVEPREQMIVFDTDGRWQQKVIIEDIDGEELFTLPLDKLTTRLRDSDLKVWCECPAFTYWGFKYIAAANGYGLESEEKAPGVRNPDEAGYVCKHLYAALKLYPALASEVAHRMREYCAKETELKEGINIKNKESLEDQFEKDYLSKLDEVFSKIM